MSIIQKIIYEGQLGVKIGLFCSKLKFYKKLGQALFILGQSKYNGPLAKRVSINFTQANYQDQNIPKITLLLKEKLVLDKIWP